MSADTPHPALAPHPAASGSPAVRIGNVLFHHRNALFPIAFVVIALVSRPRLFLDSHRADAVLDAVGLLVAFAGQGVRAVVTGLAYIRRGGKDRRIYADALVQNGFFAHSRNPLYLGNLMIFLGLFLVLNSVAGYAVGIPFFLAAYLCITAAEEDYLARRFGAEFEDYRRRVPRFFPRLEGLGQTIRGMRFDWRRLIRKEYGSTFTWMTTALALLWWESFRNPGPEGSARTLWIVLGLWVPVLFGYLLARYLKKTGRFHTA